MNLMADNANCGACGNNCAGGTTCQAGSCACPSGTSICGGACANLSVDPNNCGACGAVCGAPRFCSASACVCAGGQTFCSGACVNTASDRLNCGGCGVVCAGTALCVASTCTTATGPTITCPADTTTIAGTGVLLTATAASPGRTITGYNWTITASPTGGATVATFMPTPPTAATETFNPGVIGAYTLHVVVTDSAGATASCDTHVTAQSTGLRLELTWDGTGDLDLHLHNGVTTTPWFSTPNDCYYANRNAAWDAVGTLDDGFLDLDSITGFGPELAHVTTPVIGENYTVAVHVYASTAAGRIATTRIFCGPGSAPAAVRTSRALAGTTSGNCTTNDFWRVATVRFTSATTCTVTPIDTYAASSTACTAF